MVGSVYRVSSLSRVGSLSIVCSVSRVGSVSSVCSLYRVGSVYRVGSFIRWARSAGWALSPLCSRSPVCARSIRWALCTVWARSLERALSTEWALSSEWATTQICMRTSSTERGRLDSRRHFLWSFDSKLVGGLSSVTSSVTLSPVLMACIVGGLNLCGVRDCIVRFLYTLRMLKDVCATYSVRQCVYVCA